MRKGIFFISMLFLIPSAARAEEMTLYEISSRVITVAETAGICLSEPNACSRADASLLQEQAQAAFHDLSAMLRTGRAGRMKLSPDEAGRLFARLDQMRSLYVHPAMFEGTCNQGIDLFIRSVSLFELMVFVLVFRPEYWGLLALLAVPATIIGTGMLAAACILMLTCLLWWL